jgi:3-methyl-2-oxobutanoate hydroxymethyltransferase
MDMPFMSYQVSVEQAVANAGRLIKETGANAVKLEGGAAVTAQIKAIVDSGIPVCAHIGMTPQSSNMFGGFKVQGKGEANAKRVLEDAFAVQEAGAFMCVLECVPPKLAALITKKVDMITIGIGGGAGCDGQVLVYQDMLGMSGFTPKFVKHFGEIGEAMTEAFRAYDQEVKAGTFPTEAQSYVKSDCSDEYLAQLDAAYPLN